MYGLLLPVKKDQPKPSKDDDVQLRQTTGDKAVTMRQGKKMRNRKSAVYGSDVNDAQGVPDDTATSPIHNMNVKFVSFSPENSFDGGNAAQVEVVETRQGKVSDLVKQFEDEEKEDELKKEMVGSKNVGENAAVDVSENSGGTVRKQKPANKVFDMFEKSGIIMGMVSLFVLVYHMQCLNTMHTLLRNYRRWFSFIIMLCREGHPRNRAKPEQSPLLQKSAPSLLSLLQGVLDPH